MQGGKIETSMTSDRKAYRLTRFVTGGVTPFLLGIIVLIVMSLRHDAWEPCTQEAGICRELIAGTTVGRQALVGSCWVAPLPVLFYLPFAWLFREPFAGHAAFFTACFLVFWSVREAIKATHPSLWRILLVQCALASMALLPAGPCFSCLPSVLMMALMILAGAALSDWASLRRIRDVVAVGVSGAGLVLCGFCTFVTVGVSILMLPLLACGKRETRVRWSAWLLLGGLPFVYTLIVWVLMNRLILGDAFFFARSLAHLMPGLNQFLYTFFASGAILMIALVVTWWCDRRHPLTVGGGAVAGSAVLICFGVELMVCARVLTSYGVGWDAMALQGSALAVLMIALARLRQSLSRLAASLVLAVYLSSQGLDTQRLIDKQPAASEITDRIEQFVCDRTLYGRVFVLGYAGLDLLREYTGDRLVSNMDLHVNSLRRAYPGQNLYVLVPRPEGKRRSESVFWKYPKMYTLGDERMLYAETFGDWRLFEIIAAPTDKQLDEWQRARNLN